MALTSVKNTKADKKRDRGEAAISSHDDFPYGLSITLEDSTLKKLGITKLPQVGDDMKIAAVGSVTSVNEHQSTRRKNRSVSIQIERLDVQPTKKPTAEDAVSDAIKDA